MQAGLIGTAVPALMKLSKYDLPFAAACALERLIESLQPEFKVYTAKELTILNKYGKENPDIAGQFMFEGANGAIAQKEITALQEEEVVASGNTVEITVPADLRLSAADIKSLKPFIIFSQEEK